LITDLGPPPSGRYSASATALVILASVVSGIGASYPQNTWLQVGPVIALALTFPWLMPRLWLSQRGWSCVIAFLLLHLFAAHWTYSDVPYSTWLAALRIDTQSLFGSSRNMFDRLVHFAFGLLVVRPIVEVESNYAGVNRRLAYRLAILFVLASSAAYEIFEWTLAILISPEAAAAYNGQQGDIFDAQKDMWMATTGAVVGLVLLNRRYRRWRER
jgi:putative membrane protein